MKKVAALNSRSLLKLSGNDVVSFLQNLVTCDVENLQPGAAGFGALLSPQGKILFDFFLQRCDDGFLLDTDGEQADALTKRLTFYKLRAAVDIEPCDQKAFAHWDDGGVSGFTDPRFDKMGQRQYCTNLNTNADESDWHTLRVNLGMPQSGLDFPFGSAFPHEVLMDQFNGVDFTKGCYVGQEVVSRMQHRGTARSRVVRAVAIDRDGLPPAGTPITADGRSVGTLGSSTGANGIAIVRLDRVAKADSSDLPILAEGIALTFSRPEFASYEWPDDGE